MACITISKLSYTSGHDIARNVATTLGYALLDQEVFQEAATASGIPESKLLGAFREPPSFFGISEATRKRCIAHVSAALAKHLLKDSVVYSGPFGHVLAPGVSHVFKVKIFAQREDRVSTKVKCETNLSEEEAEKAILREDKQRAALAKDVFGINDDDVDLFDLVINTSQVDVDTAAEIIVNTVKLKRYQPMTYSIRCMENLELGLRTRACLVELDPHVETRADNGQVRIRARGSGRAGRKLLDRMRDKAAAVEGVKNVEVDIVEDTISRH